MFSEGQMKNRKRCYNCQYYTRNRCPLLYDADIGEIDHCILELDEFKEALKNERTPGYFMVTHDLDMFLKYINYMRKERPPKIGQKVVTMKSKFWSDVSVGDIRCVRDVDEKYIYLANKNGYMTLSSIENWYMNLWIL